MSREPRDSSPGLTEEATDPNQVKGVSNTPQSKESDGLWNDFMKDIDNAKCKSVPRNSTGGLGGLTSIIKKEKKPPPPRKKMTNKLPSKQVSNDLFDLSTEFIPSKEIHKGSANSVLESTSTTTVQSTSVKSEDPLANTEEKDSESDKELSSASKRPGGLSSMMNVISSKKSKVGCLDKSKVDWDEFVEKEGLKEELATFNRGKNGFVEKQMFLERADHRRFELEKGARERTRKSHI